MKPIGLYIHVPFCEQKCPYCDFYSVKSTVDVLDTYTDVVCEAIKTYVQSENILFDTVYFGGGTPSLLGSERLIKIMNVIKIHSVIPCEVTLEINPASLSKLDFLKLKKVGFNRLSIGLQTALDDELKLLGRQHSAKDAANTIKLARQSGFSNISLDLIIAIPDQTIDSLKRSIDFCINQDIQHISAYLLKVEEGTQFYKNKLSLNLKTEDEEAEMYLFLVSELKKSGFNQYEISNFAKKGYTGKHNLKYWQAQEYLGIGPSAHSFVNGKRFFYPRSIKDFLSGNIKAIDDGVGGTIDEYLMLNLRLCEGLNNSKFKSRFGFNLPEIYFKRAKQFQKYGLTFVDNENIRLTPKGFLISNELISKMLLS